MRKYFSTFINNKTNNSFPRIQTNLLINGKFTKAKSGKTFDVLNPATEEVIAKVQKADKEDVDLAVRSSRKAFDEGPWKNFTGTERSRIIFRLADLLEKHADEFAYLESVDNGKPRHIARAVDVNLAIQILRFYAGLADKTNGTTLPINGPYFCYTKSEPVGVCEQIIPWNS